ncbi:hypothetical protein KEM56_007900 [Ascosphaera pollenicola]|nr:hypothetical protein KEM56_007900 [Ascosphaera pollenicola]
MLPTTSKKPSMLLLFRSIRARALPIPAHDPRNESENNRHERLRPLNQQSWLPSLANESSANTAAGLTPECTPCMLDVEESVQEALQFFGPNGAEKVRYGLDWHRYRRDVKKFDRFDGGFNEPPQVAS